MNETFRQQPGQMLMKECDERLKAKRTTLKISVEKENIERIGTYTQVLNKCQKDKTFKP